MPEMERNLDRRRFLTLAGSAGAVSVAGCTGGDDDETDTPEETPTETPDDTPTETPEPASGQVTILHDTHFHGNLGDPGDALNVANYFGLIERLRGEYPDALVLGNGDDLHMSIESSVFEGGHVVDVFNEGGLDADVFGNHEFDVGPASLRENVADSEFPWLSANVIDSRTGDVFAAEKGARRWTVVERDGVSVGLFGLAPADTSEVTSVGDYVEVLDPVEAAEEAVAGLQEEGADVIVLQSHLASPVAGDLVSEVDGIDIVVGDHAAQSREEPAEVDGTLLSLVGDEFDYLGELHLTVEDGEVAGHEFQRHDLEATVEDGLEPHAGIEDLLSGFQQQLEEQLGEVIGETETELDVRESVVRTRESNFGNYIADVIREGMDADVALQNGGGIRSDTTYGPGEITRRTVVDVLPFPNDTVSLALTGAELLDALEHGVSAVEDGDGRFLQVSGVRYAFDADREPGDRITEATVDGEPIDENATYAVATNDFIAGGGDGYEVLEKAEVLVPAAAGERLSAAVMTAIEEDGTIAPEVEGRITVE